ncbi:MAG: radical SAM protein [Phycisphaeraceae bacterium]|nr:radical SAM protein [Phycisphaeraceae bacterium]
MTRKKELNIGLIAMSGIRACDPELLELGLTLPGFVQRSKTIASLPSLGLLTLAGMTPKRHRVQYIEVDQFEEDEHLPETVPGDFDLVAISTFTAQALEAYALARKLLDQGVMVVMGGLHATSIPEEVAAHGLSVAVGEGEITWPRILKDAQSGKLQAVYRSAPEEFDLADAPMPAFELLDISRYNRLTVQTSRGCPWHCSFCASSILLTRKYKQKPMDKVLAEIDKIRTFWKRPFIEFADDNAFVHRAYWHQLLPEIEKRHIRWFAETDLSVAEDEELLLKMRRAGCEQVLIGFESPDGAGLDSVELKSNWKAKNLPHYKEAIRRIQFNGVRVNACFVLGLDGQTPDSFEAVREFVDQTQPFDVQITYQTPFPNTPLYKQLQSTNRLTHDGEWNRHTLFDINYKPADMTREQLRAGFFKLTKQLYSNQATKARHDHFAECYKASPALQERPALRRTESTTA